MECRCSNALPKMKKNKFFLTEDYCWVSAAMCRLSSLQEENQVVSVCSLSCCSSCRPATRPIIIRGVIHPTIKITNHINYSLCLFSGFFEVHRMPSTMHTAKTITPINISIYCGNSPRNIPPKIKLAKVNFAMSINDFPTLSLMSGFSTFISMLSRNARCASVSDDVNGSIRNAEINLRLYMECRCSSALPKKYFF